MYTYSRDWFVGRMLLTAAVVRHRGANHLLSYTATNNTTGQGPVSNSLAFDLTSLGPNVFIGFTGATGGLTSKEDIINWNLSVPGPIAGAGLPGLILAGAGLLGRSPEPKARAVSHRERRRTMRRK